MRYGSAVRSTENAPCTNVPIYCPLCPTTLSGSRRTIWKYNILFHLASEHVVDDTMPAIPPQLMVDMHISKAEERRLGIEDELTMVWREENNIPGSDDIEAQHKALKRGRERAVSTSVGGPARKSVRRFTILRSSSAKWYEANKVP